MMTDQSRTAVRIPLWLVSGNILYLLSAVCILLGVSQIIVPLYEQLDTRPGQSLEKFYCLVALNAYELALLGVTVAILLWKNVTDDAVGLTLLISVFVIGSAVALDTIAPDHPNASLLFGTGGLLLACGKLYALKKYVTGPWRRWMLIWLGPILAWNFLMPAALGYSQKLELLNSQMVKLWFIGSHLILLGGFGLWISMLRTNTGAEIQKHQQDQQPLAFLHRPLMRWIILLAIVAATIAHQWALIWSFNLRLQAGDLLPAVGMLALVLIELMRLYAKHDVRLQMLIAITVLILAYVVTYTGIYSSSTSNLHALFFYPPHFLIGMSGFLCIKAAWRGHWAHAYLAILFATAGALIAGVDPQRAVEMQIWAGGSILALGLLITAAMHRSVYQANIAVAIFVLSMVIDPPSVSYTFAKSYPSPWSWFDTWSTSTTVAAAAFSYGMLCLPIHLMVGNRLHWSHTLINALPLALGTIVCFVIPDTSVWHQPLWVPVAVTSLVVMVSLRTRHWLDVLVVSSALVAGVYQSFHESVGWLLIIASFGILALGAAVSIAKGTRRQLFRAYSPEDPSDPPADMGMESR